MLAVKAEEACAKVPCLGDVALKNNPEISSHVCLFAQMIDI